MGRLALDRDKVTVDSDDGRHGTDLDALALQPPSLLDVQFQIAAELSGVAPGFADPRRVFSGGTQIVRKRSPALAMRDLDTPPGVCRLGPL